MREFVVAAGAGELLPESELTPISLAAMLRELLDAGRPRLLEMARRGARHAPSSTPTSVSPTPCMQAAGEAA